LLPNLSKSDINIAGLMVFPHPTAGYDWLYPVHNRDHEVYPRTANGVKLIPIDLRNNCAQVKIKNSPDLDPRPTSRVPIPVIHRPGPVSDSFHLSQKCATVRHFPSTSGQQTSHFLHHRSPHGRPTAVMEKRKHEARHWVRNGVQC
jgi:hypothetical protein